jgi:hypothetical protein
MGRVMERKCGFQIAFWSYWREINHLRLLPTAAAEELEGGHDLSGVIWQEDGNQSRHGKKVRTDISARSIRRSGMALWCGTMTTKFSWLYALRSFLAICRDRSSTDVISVYKPKQILFLSSSSSIYSRGWVDHVPDPLLLWKSGSAGNRTQTYGSVGRNSDH